MLLSATMLFSFLVSSINNIGIDYWILNINQSISFLWSMDDEWLLLQDTMEELGFLNTWYQDKLEMCQMDHHVTTSGCLPFFLGVISQLRTWWTVLPTPRFTRTIGLLGELLPRLEKSLCAWLKIGLLWESLPAASFWGLFSWILADFVFQA